MFPEGFDEASIRKLGFIINPGRIISETTCAFSKSTKAGEISGTYTLYFGENERYGLSLYYLLGEEVPKSIKDISQKVTQALEESQKVTEEIAERVQREAGIPEGASVVSAEVRVDCNTVHSHGQTLDEAYARLQKTAKVLGIDITSQE